MRQRGRHVQPPQEIITSLPSAANWDQAQQLRTLDAHVIAVGVAQNSVTGHYHTWVSLYGSDLTTAGVYATEEEAKAQMARIRYALKDWRGTPDQADLLNGLLANGVFESLVGPAAMVLPDADVKRVLAAISEATERKN